MKRLFDIFFGFVLLVFLAIPMLLVAISVRLTSKGPVLYWSNRVGINNSIFRMPKFRSMLVGTPIVATHLIKNPNLYLSPIGNFLRRTSLDELPQLFSILKGDMSFVGPRPALFNQYDLIELRTNKGVSKLIPGVTGWAQVNGRDSLIVSDKVDLDIEYMNNQSFWVDVKILLMTLIRVVRRSNVTH